MKINFYKLFILFIIILKIQACSSPDFTKRQYLSGRYVDKIKVQENTNDIINYEESKTQEHSLIAKVESDESPYNY